MDSELVQSPIHETRLYDVFDTVLNADTVEWCPVEEWRDLLVCGTYVLEENTNADRQQLAQRRLGQLHLLQFSNSSLQLLDTADTAGVLDAKWCHHYIGSHQKPLLGFVNASGNLNLSILSENDERNKCIDSLESVIVNDGLALSLDWSSSKYTSADPKIIVSDSSGYVTEYHLTQTGLQKLHQWKSHDHEAWVTAYNYWDTNVVFSGGDDCKLKGWDVRQGGSSPTFLIRNEMGVTAIHGNMWKEFLLATGSFDENAYIWDTRNMKFSLHHVPCGGGVWRLKWQPHGGQFLAAACMSNGALILDFRSLTDDPFIAARYLGHASLTYGIDWCWQSNPDHSYNNSAYTLSSCSFYDHYLHTWSFKKLDDSNTTSS